MICQHLFVESTNLSSIIESFEWIVLDAAIEHYPIGSNVATGQFF